MAHIDEEEENTKRHETVRMLQGNLEHSPTVATVTDVLPWRVMEIKVVKL
jgi:hypothetical protein